MRMMDMVTFVITHLSFVFCIALFFLTLRESKRSYIHIAFYFLILVMFIWNLGTLLDMYYQFIYGVSNMLFICISYLGICFSPIAVLFLGKTLSKPYLALKPAYALLLFVPCVSMVLLCTNSYHHLFFVNFSIYAEELLYGPYYYFHFAYSYACLLVGIIYLISFSIKSAGIFSRQSLLVLLGILVPLLANVLYSFNLLYLTFNIKASMFTIALLCLAIAFYKYDFLKVPPVALHNIVDLISDGYLVIDVWYNVVDYNKAMLHLVNDGKPLPQKMSLETLMEKYCAEDTYADFLKLQAQAAQAKSTILVEYESPGGKFYAVEITPVYIKRVLVGTVIMLKNITRAKRDLETIKETQATMMERERLAFLGQLIGGIAHNLKTPILSISGGVEGLLDLVTEYEESISDASVTEEDHREIVQEMYSWIDKIKTHCTYISDMVSSVKGQAIQLNPNDIDTFAIDELLKHVDLLMKNELKKSSCTLRVHINTNPFSQITGNLNSLVQVFNNLIANAIDAYDGKLGFIDLEVAEDEGKFVFSVTDYGKGMAPSLVARLFKEMVTTKGKHGTGLGLYLSYATIRGHFNGQLTVVSEVGQGTTFTIAIPKPREPV